MKEQRNILHACLTLSFAFFCCQFFFRVFEYVHLDLLYKVTYSFPELCLTAFYQDFIIACIFFGFIYLLFKTTRINAFTINLVRVFTLLLFILEFSLSEYFKIMQAPLDESIYKYTLDELAMVTGTGSRFNLNVFMHLLTVALCFCLIEWLSRKIKASRLLVFSGMVALLAVLGPFLFFSSGKGEERDILASNKLYYFSSSSIHYFLTDQHENKAYRISDFKNLDPRFLASGNVKKEFPLLRETGKQSQLGKYLRKKDRPPTIVLIIVESLSSDLVGKYAHKTGNVMPFLDSLATKSLYFPNFLSTCERTHNVLPAVLSSVPNAPEGEMLMKMNSYPDHLSLVSLLKDRYFSRFFCGVDLAYSKMNSYMNYQQTDYLVGDWEKKFTESSFFKSNSWGHPDGVLFEKSQLDLKKLKNSQQARLDIFLTISSHDPFDYPEKERYTRELKRKLKQKKLAPYYQDKMMKLANKYASFTYLDDQFRNYFREAQKNAEDFENTIFVICGDHGSELCYEDALSKFRIPLLIYSPMLKKPQEFSALNSHLNIAPTILSYLKNEYQLPLPEKTCFIGDEIDFSQKISFQKALCFNSHQFKNEYLLFNNYFLDRNKLYELSPKLKLKKASNKKVKQQLKDQLRSYNNLVSYLYYENKLVDQELKDKVLYRKPFYTYYSFNEALPEKENLKKEYISIGKDHFSIPEKTQQIKLVFSCSIFLTKKDSLSQLPTLVLAINQSDKNIFWNNAKALFPEKLSYNKWNTAKFEISVHLNDLEKLNKSNSLHFYLLNTEKTQFSARNFQTKVEFQKKS